MAAREIGLWRHAAVRAGRGLAALLIICLASVGPGSGLGPGPGLSLFSAAPAHAAAATEPVTVYYALWLPQTVGLVPVSAVPPVGLSPERGALELLVAGPPPGSGLSRTMPEGTTVLGLEVRDGLATVNFSAAILENSYGSTGEALLVGSIVNTLTAFYGIDRVWILVDGQPPGSLGGHIDITEPLSYNPHLVYRRGLPDVAGHWAEGHITAFCLTGIISGYPEGDFRPERTVTREEFVKMLVLVRGLEPLRPGQPAFQDVPLDRWSSGYVEAAVAAAILVPSDYGQYFAPSGPPSRLEMATMLVRATANEALAASLRDAPLPYTDAAQLPSWARGYIAAVTQLGLMRGYPDGSFMPQATAKRSEAVTVLSRLLSPAEGRVIIVRPAEGQSVGDRVLVLGAASTFEATVQVRVKAPDGTVFAETYATATDGGPCWGVFAALLPVPGTDAAFAVEAYEMSAEDGSEIYLTMRTVRRISQP
ncbi:MAG: S-layer homology domain-containing protein [Bacillota bacterium]|nr:S-layer homology domain-containing protein [Bacillota bacterium]